VIIQAFCPAQTSVRVDRKVARNPLLHIASTVMGNAIEVRAKKKNSLKTTVVYTSNEI